MPPVLAKRLSTTLPSVALFALAGLAAPTEVSPWQIDPAHTQIEFSVRHFFTPVEGRFEQFNITLDWDRATPANSSVSATIKTASLNTGNTRRDNHLRSGDFFDAEKNAEITFKSTSVRAVGENQFSVTGDLTIKGVTRRVEMPVRLLGVHELPADMQAMMGGTKRVASFEANLVIDRGDFGVGTGSWAETAVVGGDVKIDIRVEAFER